MDTSQTAHAQGVPIAQGAEEFFPEHPPRLETPEYIATHKLLVETLDQPCKTCGVRQSTLGDMVQNEAGAKQMETHHYPIQREYVDAVDWKKVSKDFKQVTDQKSLILFVDSPANMLVLCDVHHRSQTRGIHHLITSDWLIEQYLLDGYILEDLAKNSTNDIIKDNQIVSDNIPEEERT